MATAFSPQNVHQKAREALLSSNWWAAAIRGVLAILIGAFAIFAPAATLIALVMIFAAYALVDGVFAIVLAIRGARKHERWGWLVVSGIISIGAAAIAVLFPALTVFAFGSLFAVWAIFSGSASMFAGVQLGKSHGRWWLILGGAIAVFFGIWAILMPPLAMLALSYMVGFQAFFAGFTLLALAYRLREQQVEQGEDKRDDRTAPARLRRLVIMGDILAAGAKAPDFTAFVTPDQKLSLSDLRGKRVILAFYPADWSPVCGDQMTLYNVVLPEFRKHGAELLGISVDGAWCHQAYARHNNLHFPLIADFHPKGEIAKSYGAYRENEGVADRALFIIDETGHVVWSYCSPIAVNPGADGLLEALEKMPRLEVVNG